ncbi:MAG: phosphate ABC transporter permease PstA [Planctomycetota bacterium]
MNPRSPAARKAANRAVLALSALGALIAITFLLWVLVSVLHRGARAFDWDFFTKAQTPPGEPGGGVGHAILGTAVLTGLATLFGVPAGMLAGIYLAEYGKHGHFATLVRMLANILMGTPSIIIGIFVYTLLVLPFSRYSGYAGAAALAIIMLPVVARTTEDMLNLVGDDLREAALGLGVPKWKATLGVVCRAAKGGLLTGALLAIARVSGETAPLLFTALNSPYWPNALSQPTANLTVTIYNYAMSPYEDWKAKAWGASLLITTGVLLVTVASRAILRKTAR